ncbi:MAG: hypothetical protein ACD_54C00985G0001 [uncultured bacterium]|nr:MAG: hypothetical protein ACD_54C00985G0001 [uncultured bacterium]
MLHPRINPLAARLDADDVHRRIIEERVEQPHRVRATADRRNHRIGQTTLAFLFGQLPAHFLADDALEIAHHRRVRMRPRHRADAIEGVAHVGHPIAQRIVHRVFQRATTRSHRHHFRPQQPHAEHVRRLPFHIMRAHVDHAFQPELGADRGRRHTVLASAGFGDDPGLAHPPRQNDLAQHVVDLVRAGVVQFVALHVDLGTAEMLGQPRRIIQRRGAADVMLPQIVHFRPERRVGLGEFVALLQIEDQRHQGFRHEAATELAKAALFIRPGHKAVHTVFHR